MTISANLSHHTENNQTFLATAPNIVFSHNKMFTVSWVIIGLLIVMQFGFVFSLIKTKGDPGKYSFLWYATMRYRSSTTRFWIVVDTNFVGTHTRPYPY